MEILNANPSIFLPRFASRRLILALGALALFCGSARTEDSLEYDVKAGFLFNFTKFIQWPEDSFAEKSSPLVIGILGNDPFGEKFDKALAKEKSGGRRLVVKRYKTVQDIEACHILFISAIERAHLPQVQEKLKDTSTVITGETDDFNREGGVIRFFLEQGRVRFEINVSAARRKKLEISSQLLNLSRIYREN